MEAWRKQLKTQPENITAAICSNMRAAVAAGSDFVSEDEAVAGSATGHVTQEVGFDRARGFTYLMYGLATIFNYMGKKQWASAEALCGLVLAAGEQRTLDSGRWTLAWLVTHLPEPPWQRINHKPSDKPLRPHSNLLSPMSVASAAADTRDMAVLGDLKKKGGGPPTGPPPKTKGVEQSSG
jgi:hypothetical protein